MSVLGAGGEPILGLSTELFKIREAGSAASARVLRAETVESAQAGASIALVAQASGALGPIEAELQKALATSVRNLPEPAQVALVSYADSAEIVAPFSADKGKVADAASQLRMSGTSYLLLDGLARALSLFSSSATKVRGKGAPPWPRAIVVVSDGRDNGSAADVEKLIADARRLRIPIHAVGHSEVEQDSLRQLEEIARRTEGIYRAAPAVEDVGRALSAIAVRVGQTYVVAWNTRLDHDGREHRIEIGLEAGAGPELASAIVVRTPDFIDWLRVAVVVGLVLLLPALVLVIYALARRRTPPARLVVQKGPFAGEDYALVGPRISVGSGPQNMIRLLDPAVSGSHARIEFESGTFHLVDLGSKNGVLVNGKRVARCSLQNGDVLTIGGTELRFEVSEEA